METYSVTCRSTVFETFEIQANSAKEAEVLVELALNFGDAWSNPKFKYIQTTCEDDWRALPEYTC